MGIRDLNRSLLLQCATLCCLALLFASARAAEVLDLVTEITAEIADGDSHEYLIELDTKPALVQLAQHYFDVSVVIRDKDGVEMHRANAALSDVVDELLWFEPPEAGQYLVQIQAYSGNRPSGAYRVRISQQDYSSAFAEAALIHSAGAAVDVSLGGGVRKHNLQEAAKHFSRASILWHDAAQPVKSGQASYLEGRLLLELGRFADSSVAFQKAVTRLPKSTAVHDWSLSGSGTAYLSLGRSNDATEAFTQALTNARSREDDFAAGVFLNYLGLIAQSQNRPRSARDVYEKSLEALEKIDAPHHKAVTLSNIGGTHYQMGEFGQALDYYQKALRIHNQLNDIEEQATVIGNMSSLYREQGDLGEALNLTMRTRELYIALGSQWGLNLVAQRFGVIYQRMGYVAQAERHFKAAIEGRLASGSKVSAANSMNSLGNLYFDDGRYAQARKLHERALRLFEAAGHQVNIATTRISLARDLLVAGQKEEAAALIEQASAVVREQGLVREVARALEIQGEIAASKKERQTAVRLYNESLKIRRASDDKLGQLRTLIALAELQTDEDRAIKLLVTAEKLATDIRASLYYPAYRARFVASTRALYDALIARYLDKHTSDPEKGFDQLAFLTSERNRGRSLIDIVQQGRLEPTSTHQELHEQGQGLQQELLGLKYSTNKLRAASANDEIVAIIRANNMRMADLLTRLESLDNKLLTTVDMRKRAQALSVQQLQQFLSDDALVLHYHLGNKASVVWRVTRKQFEVVRLSDQATLTRAADDIRNRLQKSDFDAEDKAVLQRLSESFVSALGPEPGWKQLFLVADGVVHFVPFAALILQNGQFIAERMSVVTIPGSLVLTDHKTLAVHSTRRTGHVVDQVRVFADPVFSANDFRFGERKNSSALLPGQHPERLVPMPDQAMNVTRLPFSSIEAKSIKTIYPRADIAQGFAASKNNFMAEQSSVPDVLHVASHGIIDSQYPQLSGLMFSRFTENFEAIDGFVTLHELRSHGPRSRVVVLSACETAIGERIAGEGAMSLSNAFLTRGSHDVVSTLWRVADQSTAILMQDFYRGLVEHQLPASQALRAAQVAMMGDATFSAPYFWAGFIAQSVRPQ